jgi:type IV pilus assembly protein PilW
MTTRQKGLSLVELMVALVIGSILIAGAVYVYSQSRSTQRVSDTVARLQENGRYVLSIMEPDIQLAGYYGFSNSPGDIQFISGGSKAAPVAAAKLKPGGTDVESVANDCDVNFAVNVLTTVDGRDKVAEFPYACDERVAAAGDVRVDTDMLTIRRSSGPPLDGVGGPAVNNRLQLLVSRLSPDSMYLFKDGDLPDTPALQANLVQVRDLVVRSYYVSNDSLPDPEGTTAGYVAGIPSLRVISLTDGPSYDDQELMRGVEDLQLQFGYDTGSYDGNADIDPGFDEDGNGIPDAPNGIATRYVDPGAVPFGFQVVAVRVFILMRADQPEQGFVDTNSYVLGSKTIPAPGDGFRRVLLSRTIQLRNTRTL